MLEAVHTSHSGARTSDHFPCKQACMSVLGLHVQSIDVHAELRIFVNYVQDSWQLNARLELVQIQILPLPLTPRPPVVGAMVFENGF